MSNVKKYNCRICIYDNEKIYKIATIWYLKDCGYFITWLFNHPDFEYIASKISNKGQIENKISEGSIFHVPFDEKNMFTLTLNKPKISHHLDWTAHISWDWIRSWYYDDGTPKWLSIESWNLHNSNDWWPLFWFYIWSELLHFFEPVELDEKILNKPHFLFPWEKCHDLRKNKEEPFMYVIDWFYMHKSELPDDMKDWITFLKQHKKYWLMEFFPIKSPPEAPYILLLHVSRKNLNYSNNTLFSYSWAPWIIQKDWSWECLWLIIAKKWELHFSSLEYKKDWKY